MPVRKNPALAGPGHWQEQEQWQEQQRRDQQVGPEEELAERRTWSMAGAVKLRVRRPASLARARCQAGRYDQIQWVLLSISLGLRLPPPLELTPWISTKKSNLSSMSVVKFQVGYLSTSLAFTKVMLAALSAS